MSVSEIKPWSRQKGETSKAYAAFEVYRDMGEDRTTRAVAKHLSRSEALIKGWSSKWSWPERARAWDSVPSETVAEAYADMARDIAAQHRELSDKLMKRLSRNLDLMPEGTDPSMRWSTAAGAARQSHQFAADLAKPESTVKEEISKQIAALIEKLAGE